MEDLIHSLICEMGDSPDREGLAKTPKRAAKALMDLTSGYRESLEDAIGGALFACDNRELIVLKDIHLFSLCEHHLLPLYGKCHVAYYPNGKILGLSKIPRIVKHFSRRLQVQERLTLQIAEAIKDVSGALGSAVCTEAIHSCMAARGIAEASCSTSSFAFTGNFQSDEKQRLFFNLLQK